MPTLWNNPPPIPGRSPPSRSLLLLAALACATLTPACDRPPAAPELSNAPVYSDPQTGLRFLVPEGWTQSASSALPPGPLGGEIFLTRYNLSSPEQGASLQVLCLDDHAALDLARHHAEGSFRAASWQPQAEPLPVEIHGQPATRLRYTTLLDGREMTKLVTCFRRHGRVYSFVGLHWSNDPYADQQLQRAIDSITWSR
ncbi:MAG: hypothetical protein ACKO3P_15180 [Planctomycetaceae bacterium]